MPNYSLILDTKFKPFSYAEMLAPVAAATQAHQALEEEYGNLATKANVWEEMANEQTDPHAYKMYKTYSDDLKARAEQLMRYGLNASSRKGMLDMRARYSKEIVPIENAYKARDAEIKEQLAGRAQGMVYEGDAAISSLDRYLDNPSIKYRYANSQEGFKRLATAADAISKELIKSISTGRLDSYTKLWLQQHGYASSEISQAITDIEGALRGDGNVRGNNVLTSLLANEMQTSGVNDWTNKAAIMDYYNRVAPALYRAVGQTNVSTYEDYGARLAAQAKQTAPAGDDGLLYRTIDSHDTTKAKASKQAKDDAKFLQSVVHDMSLLQRKAYKLGSTNIPSAYTNIVGARVVDRRDTYYPDRDRLLELANKYGIKKVFEEEKNGNIKVNASQFNKLISAVNNDIKRGDVVNQIYVGNTADDSWVVGQIQDNIRIKATTDGKVDAYDNDSGDRLSLDDVDKFTTDGALYYTEYDSNNNVVLRIKYKDSDNNFKTVRVGLSTAGGKVLLDKATQAKATMDSGNYAKGTGYMSDIHTLLYGQANTRAKLQTKTKADLVPLAPYTDEELDVIYSNIGIPTN